MAITSFYLLNMFPQMRTYSSSPNNQHPTAKPNMFLQMRTLHHHLTINTQHPSQTCSLGCALHHHHLTINTQHPSQTCSLGCALYYHHLTINTMSIHPLQTTYSNEGVSKCTYPLFYAQSPDFLKPGLCYFLKFLYL